MTASRWISGLAWLALSLGLAVMALPKAQPWYVLMTAPAPTVLPVPVQGVAISKLVDTWGAARPGGRQHRGIDIFARRGTPVLAPVNGRIVGIGVDGLGGNVVRLLGPGRQVHYFAHLERFGPIERGQWVSAGDVLGYVGDTGNAKGTPPHLHYGIYQAPGGAINPFALLKAAPELGG